MSQYELKEAGNLQIKIFENRLKLGETAAADAVCAINHLLNKKENINIIFAAAPSQNEFLSALCRSKVDFKRINAFHMDEYAGLCEDDPGLFGNFLRRSIFEQVIFNNVYYINGNADPIAEEITRYTSLLKQYPPDIVFMGIGENGHIAFNDPHAAHFDDKQYARVVDLDERCRAQQVNDRCFASLDEVPARAITLTIPALFFAKKLFCMVPGESKAWAVKETVLGEIREHLPASILRMHPCATLFVDKDSGKHII